MSQKVEVKANIDPNLFEQVCKELGYPVYRNVNIRGYSTQHIVGDVVVEIHGYGVGIKDGNLIYDDWDKRVKSELDKIMPSYFERLLKSRLKGYHVNFKPIQREWVFTVWR